MSFTGKPEEISVVFWIKETKISLSSIGSAPLMSTENGPKDRVRNCGESILINLREDACLFTGCSCGTGGLS